MSHTKSGVVRAAVWRHYLSEPELASFQVRLPSGSSLAEISLEIESEVPEKELLSSIGNVAKDLVLPHPPWNLKQPVVLIDIQCTGTQAQQAIEAMRLELQDLGIVEESKYDGVLCLKRQPTAAPDEELQSKWQTSQSPGIE